MTQPTEPAERPAPPDENDRPAVLAWEHNRKLHIYGYTPSDCSACWPHGVPAPSPPSPERDTRATDPLAGSALRLPNVRSLGYTLGVWRATQARSDPDTPPSPEEPAAKVSPLDGGPWCERCKGMRFFRMDVPFGDPEFGISKPCAACTRPGLLRRQTNELLERARVPVAFRPFTLENFPVSDESRPSYELVCAWWDKLRTGQLPPDHMSLFLWGEDTGLGKTSLACSILSAWSVQQASSKEIQGQPGHIFQPGGGDPEPGALHPLGSICYSCGEPPAAHPVEGFYLTMPDLLDAIRATYSNTSTTTTQEIMDAVGAAPFMVLDDLGTEAPTLHTAEKLLQIINHRHDTHLPTIFTSNLSLSLLETNYGEMAGLRDRGGVTATTRKLADLRGKRLVWRMIEMSTVIEFHGDNLRDPAVLQRLGLRGSGLNLPLPLDAPRRPARPVPISGRPSHPDDSEEEPRAAF